jgi:hypothetical protein
MKKFFLVAIILFSLSGMAVGMLNIDLTGATIQVKDSTSIRASGVTVIGLSGTYWAELKWDPAQMILVPTAYGLEVAEEKTWNFLVSDDSSSYYVTLKSNADRTFDISFSPGTGNPFVCVTDGYRFMQGNNTFDLSRSQSDTNTALITFSGGWNGCNYISQGQTVSATISNIPSWLDFNSQFSIGINSDIIVLETDGQAVWPMILNQNDEAAVTLAAKEIKYFTVTTPAGGCSAALHKWLRITMINVDLTAGDGQLLVKSSNHGTSTAMPTLPDYTYEFGLLGYGGGQDWTRDPNGGVFFWNWGIGGSNEILAVLPTYTGQTFNQDDTYYLLLYNQGARSNDYRVLWQCY